MRAVAEFVMKSRGRAIGSAVATAFVPVLSLVSCAIVALVWLRMGRNEGIKVLLAAAIPGLYYWLGLGSPDVLLALIGAAVLAEVLHSQQGWSRMLLIGAFLASLVALSVQWLSPDMLREVINLLLDQGGLAQQYNLSASDQEQLRLMFGLLLNGVITGVQLIMLIVSMALARWWQGLLYNPGGFQQEFHALRLPAWSGLVLPLVMVVVASGQSWLMPVIPVLVVPHLIAGLALIHGIFGIKQYNSFWLGLLYVTLLFALPYMSVLLVLIALADSLMNFRHRLAPPPPPPPRDGDGES
ncbi:hypothetical protein SAMN02745752_02708 [Marinospirillum alkaliphilum DSM 21637]|uniref:DUF2232 domain-containing protein n=2 Tax=Marinospirillum TaxID=64968 RepID=A0A1K1ZHM1_9GAMM|nr:hypothetical protein SAMN02745752_02708 [Marinospirillum alkaliphilum DSM 21637]